MRPGSRGRSTLPPPRRYAGEPNADEAAEGVEAEEFVTDDASERTEADEADEADEPGPEADQRQVSAEDPLGLGAEYWSLFEPWGLEENDRPMVSAEVKPAFCSEQ